MSRMKLHDGARRFSARAILSTIAGESLDRSSFPLGAWWRGTGLGTAEVDALAGGAQDGL